METPSKAFIPEKLVTHVPDFPPIEFGPPPKFEMTCESDFNLSFDISVVQPIIPSIQINLPEPPKFSCVVIQPIIPSIQINLPEPPKFSCVVLIESPGSTWQEILRAKRNLGILSQDEKCAAIVRVLAGLMQDSDWTPYEGQGIISDQATDPNFRIFVDGLYKELVEGSL